MDIKRLSELYGEALKSAIKATMLENLFGKKPEKQKQKPTEWKIEIENDVGDNDDYYREWWSVNNNITKYHCDTKKEAEFLCALLNKHYPNKDINYE